MALGKGLQSLIPQNGKNSSKNDLAQTSVDKIWQIPLSEIIPNSEQPRKNFSHQELEDLVMSIKKHGVLQPINVTENSAGGYELIAGERRFRASQIAGLTTIPAIVRTASQQQKLELALIENIQRQDLNAIEEAVAYKKLMDEFNLTQEQVAEQVGKSRPAVANTIRLLDLPDEVQKALVEGIISAGKARALLSLESKTEQLNVFKEMVGAEYSVRDVEARVYGSKKGIKREDVNVLAQEKMLEERLGTKVNITRKGEQGTILIHFYSVEEMRRLLDNLSV